MQEHPDRTVIVSGGKGPDEADTEASVMARYLIEHGADAVSYTHLSYRQALLMSERTGRILSPEQTLDDADIYSGDTLYLV